MTTGAENWFPPRIFDFLLLNRSENDRQVIKTYNANGVMLRRSDQLLLAAENHHFEGSTHLKAKEGNITNARLGDGGLLF